MVTVFQGLKWKAFAARSDHWKGSFCGIDKDTDNVECFGNDAKASVADNGPSGQKWANPIWNTPKNLKAVSIVIGGWGPGSRNGHACAIAKDTNMPVCWGTSLE